MTGHVTWNYRDEVAPVGHVVLNARAGLRFLLALIVLLTSYGVVF